MMNKSIKALCLAGLSFLSFSFAQSQISSNLSFSLTSGPFLPVDANSCGVDLPTAYLVGVKAVNSGSTEINVGTLTLDSLPNSGWSVIGPLNAEVKIGKLAANQERTAFYYVRANCSDKGNLVGLRLTANNGSNTQYFRTSLTVEGIISANSAGSITSNYANLDVIGSIIYDTNTFSFSGFKSGNHHLMNPSSLVTFKATLLELQECEVLSVSHTGLGIAAGDINKTYFKAGFNAQGSTNYTVTQVFKWKVVDFGDSTLLVPMSANQQGGTNIKGLVADSSWGSTGKPVVISSSANTISLTKSVSPSRYSQGDTLTYSLKVSNSSSLADVAIDYINDTLPSGLTFIGIDQTGDVDSVDLSSIPTLSSTGSIRFIGGSQDATTGDISIQVPKYSSVTLKYKVKAGTTATGDLINKSGVFVGARALDTARVTISEYGAPALDTLKTVAITCNGGSDGEVHLTANDAPRPFTWSKDGTNYQSDSSFKNLTSGSYTFYAKSNSGKISTINVTLTNPNALSISGGNSVCVGWDITLTGSGTAATTNAWVSATTSVATITSAGVLTGVSSGTSVITYTDNNGCTVTETVTVNALPTVAVSPTSASITSGNSQSLTASGATSYSWSPSTGLSATTGGTVTASPTTTTTYTVTGTDANGCVNTASSTITVGSSLTAGAIAGNTTICSGGDPAAFTSSSSASGGTGSYTYEWESSTNSGSTWSAISSSNSTTYDVPSGLTQTTQYRRKVSDGSNTAYSNTLTVTVNANPNSSGVSVTNVSCNGGTDGSADITVTGGTSPYTYAWSGPSSYSSTSEDINTLSAGTYSVTVTDANSCTSSNTNVVVTEPTALTLSNGSQTNVDCNGNSTGSVTVSAAGGTSPYEYKIGTGSYGTSATFSSLSAGSYTVTAKDANGCTQTLSVTITEPAAISVSSISSTNVTCNGASDGTITITATGGGTLKYSIDNGSTYQSSNVFSALAPGSYTVVVSDNNNCNASYTPSQSVTITQPGILTLGSIVPTDPSCLSASDGKIVLNVTGGNTISYSIDSGTTFQGSNTFTGLSIGIYKAVIKDNLGCAPTYSNSQYVTLVNGDQTNPVAVVKNASVNLNASGSASISYSDIENGSSDNCGVTKIYLDDSTFNCSDAGVNKVILTVEDAAGNQDTAHAYVTVSDAINPVAVVKNASVNLNASGSASISYSDIENGSSDNCGVTKIYLDDSTFNCSDAGVNKVILTVEDAAGNQDTAHAYVTVSDAINPVVIGNNLVIYLDSFGSVSITNEMAVQSATDNCSVKDTLLDKYTFDCSDTGKVNEVVITVSDDANNSHKDTIDVIVYDKISPVIRAKDITLYLDNNGKVYFGTNDIDTGSFDNCSIKSREVNIDSFDCGNVGNNAVVYTVEDHSGNVSTKNITITVLDTIKPLVTVKTNIVYLDTAAKGSIVNASVISSTYDNCGILDSTVSQYNFTIADTGWVDLDVYVTDVNGNKTGPVRTKVLVLFADSDNDSIPDYIEGPEDTDGDGVYDYLDLDSDNDGILDVVENEGKDFLVDFDSDGKPNYKDLDADNDGIDDVIEADGDDPDFDGIAGNGVADVDQNGVPKIANGGYSTANTDNAEKADFLDEDADNDGIPDNIEKGPTKDPIDTDNDGLRDWRSLDSDGDGIPDEVEKGSDANNPIDTDGDGTPDYRDLDSDNDGIPDEVEKGSDGNNPVDTDGDGTPDYRDLDSDNDGIPDEVEKGPDGNNPIDTDGDGTPDYRDLDSDNDGIPDEVEKGSDGNNPVDTDGDGTPDYRDLDSDNDGIPDEVEKGSDGNNPIDTDGDGTPDYRDLDSDNDGIPDEVEKGSDGNNPIDTDGDGTPDYRDLDSDNDGLSDEEEAGDDGDNPEDSDGDGIPDFRELDADDDGVKDADEFEGDCDGDGIPNNRDSDPCEPIIPNGFSPNGDGVNDNFQIPGIEAYKNNKVIIYNRWGNVVYQASRYQNQWDGTSNTGIRVLDTDGKVPDGTYFYFVDLGDGSKPRSGSLYINRVKKY